MTIVTLTPKGEALVRAAAARTRRVLSRRLKARVRGPVLVSLPQSTLDRMAR